MSRLIALEGAKGTGKTEQIRKISSYLHVQGASFKILKEPTMEHPIGKFFNENYIYGDMDSSLVTQMLMFFSARSEMLEREVRDASEDFIIFDRCYVSSYIRQAYLKSDSLVRLFHELVKGVIGEEFQLDSLIILDADPEMCMKRVTDRGRQDNLDEVSKNEYNRRMNGYRQFAMLYNKYIDNISIVDANRTINEVFEDIVPLIK